MKKRLELILTDSLLNAIREAAGNQNASEYIRELIQADLRLRGLDFEPVAPHGDASRWHDPARQPKAQE